MIRNYLLSILVKNSSGVLTHVSGMFARRGYNIRSLSVGETESAEFSRITIALNGDEHVLDQIKKQLRKMEEVVKIKELPDSAAVLRELVLVKVRAAKENRSGIMEVCNVFNTRIVDLSHETITIELSGRPAKNDAFLELVSEYGIAEMVRTGVTGLARGEKTLLDD